MAGPCLRLELLLALSATQWLCGGRIAGPTRAKPYDLGQQRLGGCLRLVALDEGPDERRVGEDAASGGEDYLEGFREGSPGFAEKRRDHRG